MHHRYDRPIIIQRGTQSVASDGTVTMTWADLAYRCFAQVTPTRGSERMTTAQEVAEQEVTFTVRFHTIPSASRPLLPQDRIIYPADGISANAQAPATNLIHDILSADVVGRDVDLSIKTKRRADVLTS